MVRLTVADLRRSLDDRLAASLSHRFGKLEISFLSQATDVADGTTVLLLRDATGRSRAVVLCAAPSSPDMVRRAAHRAREAKMILGPSIGTHILEPLLEGSLQGLSYAVMPYCNSLSNFRPVWWMQRALLRPIVLSWLFQATEGTVRNAEPANAEQGFAEPLRAVAALKLFGSRIRTAAEWSLEQLRGGEWSPKYVLMHGDLWKNNILIRPESDADERSNWRNRFVIIDWPGSEIRGYAMYDLVRFADSMRLPARSLKDEVNRHCRLLDCGPKDATSYLLAGLGYILMNLEHFPIDKYVRMAESCYTTLAGLSD